MLARGSPVSNAGTGPYAIERAPHAMPCRVLEYFERQRVLGPGKPRRGHEKRRQDMRVPEIGAENADKVPYEGNIGHDQLSEGEHRPWIPARGYMHAPDIVLGVQRSRERVDRDEGEDHTREADGALGPKAPEASKERPERHKHVERTKRSHEHED